VKGSASFDKNGAEFNKLLQSLAATFSQSSIESFFFFFFVQNFLNISTFLSLKLK